MENKLIERTVGLEDAFNKTTDSALQLMEINKEHQRINGELRKEIERLHSIIKEVRELLKNDYFEDGSFTNYKKVFELLDKGE